jgi:hypothetical protein
MGGVSSVTFAAIYAPARPRDRIRVAFHDTTGVQFLDGPGRREAAGYERVCVFLDSGQCLLIGFYLRLPDLDLQGD